LNIGKRLGLASDAYISSEGNIVLGSIFAMMGQLPDEVFPEKTECDKNLDRFY
jgi:hypothetical protein